MTIIRTFHDKKNPYSTLNNQALFDPNLSNAARGLWAQCMARKDDWVFYMSEIQKNTTDGRTAVSSQINQLIRAGYAARLQIKEKKDGKLVFKKVEYIFFESKCTPESKKEVLQSLKNLFDYCEFLEPKPKGDTNKESDELKKCFSQSGFPRAEIPYTENQHLLNTDRESTQIENTNIIAPEPEPPKPANPPPPKQMPAGGNNNSFKCLEKCDDLSDRQKRMLMKHPEPVVEQAVRYCYHPTTQIRGGPLGRIKLLQYVIQNLDQFKESIANLDAPKEKASKKDVMIGQFKRGEIYNGYEFLQDDIGVGFWKEGMRQPYSVNWDAINFTSDFFKLLKKLRIEFE